MREEPGRCASALFLCVFPNQILDEALLVILGFQNLDQVIVLTLDQLDGYTDNFLLVV